jgi:hypothetical protein
MKATDYKEVDMQWFTTLLKNMLVDGNAAQGLLL